MKRMILLAIAALGLATPVLAAPGDITVASAMAKADALRAQGPLALMSPDMALLRGEGKAAGDNYRARLRAERAAGRPSSCPPGEARVGTDEMIAYFKTWPAAKRQRTTLNQGVAEYFITKYPCRK